MAYRAIASWFLPWQICHEAFLFNEHIGHFAILKSHDKKYDKVMRIRALNDLWVQIVQKGQQVHAKYTTFLHSIWT